MSGPLPEELRQAILGLAGAMAAADDQARAMTDAELGEMLPTHTSVKESNGRWYANYQYEQDGRRYHEDTRNDTEADARAALLIYLLENNLLTSPNEKEL